MEDYVGLKSTLHAIDNPRFQCSKCIKQFSGRRDEKEMLLRDKQGKACDFIANETRHHINYELKFKRCIGNFFDYGAVHMLTLYNKYEKGMLPFNGCLSDQPNKIIEVFNIIESYKSERMIQEQNKQKQRSRMAQGSHGRK